MSGLAVRQYVRRDLALTCLETGVTCLETGVALADHEHLATTANDLAVTVTGLGRLQGVEDFHGETLRVVEARKRGIVAMQGLAGNGFCCCRCGAQKSKAEALKMA